MNPAPALAAVHAPSPPFPISVAFILLVAVLYVGLLSWLRGPAGVAPQRVTAVRVVVFAWLVLVAVLAMAGLLENFQAIPPRVALVAAPAALAGLVLALHPATGPVLDRVSGLWLVGFQIFRVPMELILWQLALAKVIPVSMTFEGRNFDILVGLTAPLVAWLGFAKQWVSPGPVIFWNVFGLVLLGNIVTVGILSTPAPFRRFFDGPPNEMVAYFPFVWLVSFVVPLAFTGHLASIRQQLRVLKARRSATVETG